MGRHSFFNDLRQCGKALLLFALFMGLLEVLLGKTCFFRILFGIPCPGCGLSRAAVLLIRGCFPESLSVHPFLIPLILSLAVGAGERYLLGRPPRMFAAALSLCFAGMAILYIYRMRRDFPDTPPMLYDPENLLAAFRTILWTHFS